MRATILTRREKVARQVTLLSRRKTAGVLVGAAAVLLAAAGCGPSASTADPVPAPNPAVSAPATKAIAGPPADLVAPDTIGALTKAADQTKAQAALASLKKQSDLKATVSQSYADSADPTHTLLVSGLIKSAGDTPGAADLDELLTSRVDPDSPVKPVAVGSGNVGGTARCIDSSAGSSKTTECAWINGRSLLLFRFEGFELAAASALVPTVLNAVVKA
jgi:hypothetical protein